MRALDTFEFHENKIQMRYRSSTTMGNNTWISCFVKWLAAVVNWQQPVLRMPANNNKWKMIIIGKWQRSLSVFGDKTSNAYAHICIWCWTIHTHRRTVRRLDFIVYVKRFNLRQQERISHQSVPSAYDCTHTYCISRSYSEHACVPVRLCDFTLRTAHSLF